MSDANGAVVIGIGNEWRSDDGAGLAVARALRERSLAGVRVIDQDGELGALLDALAGADLALVVDSTRSSCEPGTVRRLDPSTDDLTDALPRTSSHALGLADALELARTLGDLPPRVIVYGIEGATFEAGNELSEPVRAAVAEVVDAIRAELDQPGGPELPEGDPCTSKR